MEINCQQCSSAFTIDVEAAPGASLEVVCPNCFLLHKVTVPAAPVGGPAVPESRTASGGSSLGDGGVADRLRDGFTLAFELRHPGWPAPRKLNPFEIRRLIYDGQFDGTEEFRENQGRWFSIGEHPDFSLIFQLIGRPLQQKKLETADANQPRFSGWRSAAPPPSPPTATPVAEDTFEVDMPGSSRRWMLIAAGVVVLAAAGAAFALFH